MKNLALMVTFLVLALNLYGQARTESNVIFGMYSGAALLMDVHYPEKPNGYGLIQIPGSAFQAPLAYGARPLKAGGLAPHLGTSRLVDAGYTVFTVNHRAAPRFRYPAAVEDVQRAVRFIRHHAAEYGVNADRIGATGGSSGGHLALMLGVLDGAGDSDDPDPVNRKSAKVQTVATLFAPVDMVLESKGVGQGSGAAQYYLGVMPPRPGRPGRPALNHVEAKLYREASVDTYISADDPPFLLVHGDNDQAVSFEHSVIMDRKLKEVGVEVKFIKMPGGGHGGSISAGPNPTDYVGAMIEWFDRYLRRGD
jgi:acetyl esterase/lipase